MYAATIIALRRSRAINECAIGEAELKQASHQFAFPEKQVAAAGAPGAWTMERISPLAVVISKQPRAT
jgi:hypothetical protein